MKKNIRNKKKQLGHRKGYTLIELLVVVAITSMLVVAVAVNVEKAKSKSRDSQRKTDISAIAVAVETYKVDNKKYPTYASCYNSSVNRIVYSDKISGEVPSQTCVDQYYTFLSGYIVSMPKDPGPAFINSDGTNTRLYKYSVAYDGVDYQIMSHHPENPMLADPSLYNTLRDGGSDHCILDGSSTWAWSIQSPGAKCW